MPITQTEFKSLGPGDTVKVRVEGSEFEGLDGVHVWKIYKRNERSAIYSVTDVSPVLKTELNGRYNLNYRKIIAIVDTVYHEPTEEVGRIQKMKNRAYSRGGMMKNIAYQKQRQETKLKQMNEILRMRNAGESLHVAAEKLGIAYSTATNYVHQARLLTPDRSVPSHVEKMPTDLQMSRYEIEEKVLRLHEQGMTDEAIAAKFGHRPYWAAKIVSKASQMEAVSEK